jgi:hypothetical protein
MFGSPQSSAFRAPTMMDFIHVIGASVNWIVSRQDAGIRSRDKRY